MSTQSKSRPTLLIAVLAVVVAVIAWVGLEYPIGGDDTVGTVAPAERIRGEQVSSDDVMLDDESVAQVMQTDVYQMIISDAAFAEAMRSPQFQRLLQDAELVNTMRAAPELHRAIGRREFAGALNNADLQAALSSEDGALTAVLRSDEKVRRAFQSANVAAALADDAQLRLLRMDGAMSMLGSPAFRTMFVNKEAFRLALLSDNTAAALSADASLLDALKQDAALKDALAADAQLAAAFANDDGFLSVLGRADVQAAIMDGSMRAGLAGQAFQNLMRNDAVASLAAQGDVLSAVLRDDQALRALHNADVQQALGDAELAAALAGDTLRRIVQRDPAGFRTLVGNETYRLAFSSEAMLGALQHQAFSNALLNSATFRENLRADAEAGLADVGRRPVD